MHVFIADDSKSVRTSLKDALTDIADIIVSGETGDITEVMHLIKRSEPDFVILDLRMQGGTSFGMIRKIKRMLPNVTIAVFTAFPYDLYRRKCLEMGADYFFEKSMESDRLLELMQRKSKDGAQQTV